VEEPSPSQPRKKTAYKAVSGDEIDQLLAATLKELFETEGIPIPEIKRLGVGKYEINGQGAIVRIINGRIVGKIF
jgi:hypothetical protein